VELKIVCLPELFRSQILLSRGRTPGYSTSPSRFPAPSTERLGCCRATIKRPSLSRRCFERRAPWHLSQYGGDDRNVGGDSGTLPEDAYPRRIRSTSKNSTFTPGDLGFRSFRYAFRTHLDAGFAGTSGIRKRRAFAALGGCADSVLSHRHWLASIREGAIWSGRSTRLGKPFSDRTPDSQWDLCRSGESRRLRRPRPDRGLEFWGASFVADPFGQVIAEASHGQRGKILITECDPARTEDVRAQTGPFSARPPH